MANRAFLSVRFFLKRSRAAIYGLAAAIDGRKETRGGASSFSLVNTRWRTRIYSNYVRMHILSPLLLLEIIHNRRNKYAKNNLHPNTEIRNFQQKLLANKLSLNHSHHVLPSLRKILSFSLC